MSRRQIAASAVAVVVATGLPVVVTQAAHAASATYYRPADGVLHLAGHGYGHGHGMSQWGAYGGATSGKTYREILGWYYNSAPFGTSGGSIKVQITSDGRNGDGTYDAQVKPAAGLTAVDSAGDTLALPAADAAGTAYDGYRAVLLKDGTFRVQAHAGSTWSSLAPSGDGKTATSWTGWIRLSAKGGVLNLIRSGGSTELYRENIELDKTSSGTGITVNRLTLEHYLAGVVSSEMPCGWTPTVDGTKRLDALESQAVAARSYAAWRWQHPRSSQVDIVDTTSDQAYHGYSAEKTAKSTCPWTNADGSKTSAALAAIEATAGQVLVDSDGKPIFAQYSASNGGFETAGSQSYLPQRPDAWDGVPTDSWNSHSWTDSITAGQIQSAYPSIGSFASLTVGARESLSGTDQNGRTVGEQWGGRITSLTLNGSSGSVTVSGASFASAFGLMGPWFTVVVQKPDAPAAAAASAGDAQATVRWSPPAHDGGGGIRSYTITASPAITPVTVSGSARSAVVTGLANDTSYVFSVAAGNTAGRGPATSAAAVTPSARVVFHPLPPTRILDTRSHGGAIGKGRTRSVRVAGVGGVPSSGVVDVALDVVSIDPTAASSLSVFPHGGPTPATAQLSWTKGQRANSLVWVKLGPDGSVDLRNNSAGSTHVFVDVQGYYTSATAAGDVMTPVASYKLFDSRSSHQQVPGGGTRVIPVVGRAGVPAGATAAVVQLTASKPAKRDYVRAWATGTKRPAAYDLYASPRVLTNATAVVPLTSSGSITVSPVYATHLVVTLEGWFTSASSPGTGVTSLVTPTHRVVRISLAAHATRTVSLGAPSAAAGGIVSIAAAGSTGTPVTVWAANQATPAVASLHLAGGWSRTSRVVPAGTAGKVTIRNGGRAAIQVVLDLAGWA